MQKFWIVQVLNCIGFKIVSETTVDIWKAWIKNLSLTLFQGFSDSLQKGWICSVSKRCLICINLFYAENG